MALAASSVTDTVLVARVRAGDDAAFDAIVQRHRPRLLAHAKRVLGDRRDLAEDVVQEALWRAHRALRRDDREMKLVAWLLVLTRNCALDELARQHESLPMDDVVVAGPTSAEPAATVERRAEVRGVLEGIASLPTEQRHALLRREVDGASHHEVAAELGISSQASRALVFRARENLTKQDEARGARCDEVQDDLLRAHRAGRRASAHAHRHLVVCAPCRTYRANLRSLKRALRLLHPGPGLVLGVLAVKGGLAAKALASGGGAAGATGTTGTTGGGALAGAGGGAAAALSGTGAAGGLAGLLAAAAIGATVLVLPGDPSPVDVRSPAVPGGALTAGEPLPRGIAIAARTARTGTTAALTCPAGTRVADLLPPGRAGVAAGYVAPTVVGRSRTAHVALAASSATTTAGVAVLCRRPDPRGSLVAPSGARAATAGPGAAACVRHAYLRTRPRGAARGSVRLGEPLRVLARRARWTQVRTDLGATGWVPRGAVCG